MYYENDRAKSYGSNTYGRGFTQEKEAGASPQTGIAKEEEKESFLSRPECSGEAGSRRALGGFHARRGFDNAAGRHGTFLRSRKITEVHSS